MPVARIFLFYDVSDFLYRDHRLGGGTDHRLYAWRLDSSLLLLALIILLIEFLERRKVL